MIERNSYIESIYVILLRLINIGSRKQKIIAALLYPLFIIILPFILLMSIFIKNYQSTTGYFFIFKKKVQLFFILFFKVLIEKIFMNISKERKKIIEFVKCSLGDSPLIEDLGDYIPFLAYYGEKEFCKKQIEMSTKKMRYGLFFGDSYMKIKPFKGKILMPELTTDSLLGLIDYYRITNDKFSLLLAEKIMNSLFKYHVKNNHIYSLFITGINVSLPFIRGLNGIYIELLVDMYELTNQEKYLDMANKLANAWINLDFFKKHKLFPTSYFVKINLLNRLWRDSEIITMFKHNTSIINGFISLYEKNMNKKIEQAINCWIKSIKNNMFDGSIYGKFNIKSLKHYDPSLMASFPVIDILCDFYNITKDSDILNFAEEIANFWLLKKSDLNLFPQRLNQNYTLIDTITDFSISLFRLHELTKKSIYKKTALNAIKSNMKHHSCVPDTSFIFRDGKPCFALSFIDSVNYLTGEHLSKRINTKFIALMLKPLIYIESEEKIYKKKLLFKLMRDR